MLNLQDSTPVSRFGNQSVYQRYTNEIASDLSERVLKLASLRSRSGSAIVGS